MYWKLQWRFVGIFQPVLTGTLRSRDPDDPYDPGGSGHPLWEMLLVVELFYTVDFLWGGFSFGSVSHGDPLRSFEILEILSILSAIRNRAIFWGFFFWGWGNTLNFLRSWTFSGSILPSRLKFLFWSIRSGILWNFAELGRSEILPLPVLPKMLESFKIPTCRGNRSCVKDSF